MKKLRKTLRSVLLIVTALTIIKPAYAILPGEEVLDYNNKNGIYYYNSAGNTNDCNSSATQLVGSDTAEKIWNFFIEHGFNDAETAGILGNAMQESSLSLTVLSRTGSTFGLFQWGFERKESLYNKIREAGLGQYLAPEYSASGGDKTIPQDDYDKLLQIELEHAASENTLNWQKEIKKSDSPEYAAEVFLVLFERAVDMGYGNGQTIDYYTPYLGLKYQNPIERRNFAREYFNKYAGKGIAIDNSIEDGKNLSIIGNSVTADSTLTLQQKYPKLTNSQIIAHSGYTWNDGIQIAKLSNLNNVVIFQLGSDTGLSQASLEEAIEAIGNDKTIVLITNYDPRNPQKYQVDNQKFVELSTSNSNIIVADWASAVSNNPQQYYDGDYTSLNSAGADLFVQLIDETIKNSINTSGCTVNGEFQKLVKAYAWPEWHESPWHDRMPAYAEAVTQSISEGRYVGGSVLGIPGIDCGGFVTILTQNSGLEPNYNDTKGPTYIQEAWAKNHNWILVNGSPDIRVDTSKLQPGDIAFSSGHTFIYVGEIPGFDSVIASASFSTNGKGRAPMAGREDLLFGKGVIVRWYRNPNFHPSATTTSVVSLATGTTTNSAPSNAQLLSNHHISFFTSTDGKNASTSYNNGNLAPGQASSDNLPLGTVVYIQTQQSGEASFANGKYYLITARGAGVTDEDYNISIYHDTTNPALNNTAPYSTSSTAKIYKVAEGVSWTTFKTKYGW